MAQIEILSERDGPAGWAYEAQVLDETGRLERVSLSLAWSDYNLWSPDGGAEPSRVAEAVLAYLLSKAPGERIRPRLDASLVRRLHPNADAELPAFIRRRD